MVFLIFWRVDTVRSSSSNSFRSAKYAETVSMQVRAAMGGGGVGGGRGGGVYQWGEGVLVGRGVFQLKEKIEAILLRHRNLEF